MRERRSFATSRYCAGSYVSDVFEELALIAVDSRGRCDIHWQKQTTCFDATARRLARPSPIACSVGDLDLTVVDCFFVM